MCEGRRWGEHSGVETSAQVRRGGRCADASLDDLVGKGEDLRRHYKAQLLRGLQVDEQDGLSGERDLRCPSWSKGRPWLRSRRESGECRLKGEGRDEDFHRRRR